MLVILIITVLISQGPNATEHSPFRTPQKVGRGPLSKLAHYHFLEFLVKKKLKKLKKKHPLSINQDIK